MQCVRPLRRYSLPPAVLNCDSLSTFKSRLKTHLFSTDSANYSAYLFYQRLCGRLTALWRYIKFVLLLFKAAVRVKLMYMIKSWVKNSKKRKYGNYRSFYINLHLKDSLGMEFTARLSKLIDTRGSADIFYVRCISLICGRGQALLMTSQSRSRTKYLSPTDNIILLDWYFNLTEKSNLLAKL